MILAAAAVALQAAQLVVGPSGPYTSVAPALAAARAGDTVRVSAGVYHEHLTIERPVVLLGAPGAVLTGDGRGVVVTVRASAVIRGFVIRDSGADQALEDAGILADGADGLVIEDNRLEDVLFGVYVKHSRAPVIRRNVITGRDLPPARRGDGIHLWYSHDGVIEANQVRRTRDVVIWFSNGTEVRGNVVSEGRYGLHYMNSASNRFSDNRFFDNEVGAIVMYSDDITFRRNLFANALGARGLGLAFKDSDRIVADDNVIVKNAIGIFLDNSPHLEGVTNTFRDNLVAYNDVGVSLLPSVHHNVFRGNQFVDNVQPVSVSGGGSALANEWSGNYWSEYAGFDPDGDGFGNTPFVHDRLSDDLLAKHPGLQLFSASLAVIAINTLSRVLPLLEPQPIVVDSLPRLHRRWP